MSSIEQEARGLLLSRLHALSREAVALGGADPAASWVDWEAQADAHAEALRRETAEVEAALRRIEEGSYGRCQACGGPLGLQRLRAIPEARLCLSCAAAPEDG